MNDLEEEIAILDGSLVESNVGVVVPKPNVSATEPDVDASDGNVSDGDNEVDRKGMD